MKKLLMIAILGLMSAPAVAADLGGRGGMKDDLSEVISPRSTWSGFTLSLGVASDMVSAGVDGENVSASFRDISVSSRLAYAHQFQGGVVAGAYGELGYNGVIDSYTNGQVNSITESLGGTLGIAIGNVKPYALLGVEFADGFNQTGLAYGAGVDFKITDHWVAALEWRRINWNSDVSWLNVDEDRIGGRIGYQF